jgi:hypothetical protein
MARIARIDGWRFAAMALIALSCSIARGGEGQVASSDPVALDTVRQAIQALDRDEFSARDQAAQRLQKLIDDHQFNALLAREFSQALLREETTSEVRARLDEFLKQLPPAPSEDYASSIGSPEIVQHFDRLNSDSCLVRDTAERRLYAMLNRVELIAPLLTEIKRAAAVPDAKAHQRRVLEPLLDRAREAWLLADPQRVSLPPISAERITRWVDELVAASKSESAGAARQAAAERELLDAIARDDSRAAVLEILNARIPSAGDAAIASHLQQIADFAKPAMAAEVWQNHVNLFVQYLIIGVPQFNSVTMRPTHFDRIDDKTAHCVAGNSLTPGDYPVRVAIAHPEPGRDLMFYLTNLPTPRSRLAYEYQVRRNQAARLADISRRTLDYLVEHKRVLDEQQILMLEQLDARAVSRFAGPYFQSVPDGPLSPTTNELSFQTTVYSGICHMLARFGTHEAVPDLEQLARSGKLGEPTYETPFRIAWIAALAIAERDTWPEADAWLSRLIDEKVSLATNIDQGPEVGATAAATLLEHHGLSPQSFGLESCGEGLTERFRLAGFRFASEADRDAVQRWWAHQTEGAPPAATP